MARHDFDLTNAQKTPQEIIDPDDRVIHFVNQHVLRLKRRGPDGKWAPDGVYEDGEVLLEVWRPDARAVEALNGFSVFGEEVDSARGNQLLYRLGNENGLQPLFYDKVTDPLAPVWRVPVSDDEWNTELEVDEGISSFPFDGTLACFLKMVSGDGTTTPVFRGFYIFWEARYDPTEDILRSLHRKLVDEVFIHGDDVFVVDDGATDELFYDTPDLTEDEGAPIWRPEMPIAVYKPSEDPGLRNNLFQSFVDGVIKLVSPQEGQLLIQYRGRLDRAHVVSDPDFEREELPAVVINNLTQPRKRDFLLSNRDWPEPLRSKGVVRLRAAPARHDYSFQIQVPSQYALHDKKLADAVRRAFDTAEYVRSLALDEDFPLVGLENVTQVNRTGDQVFLRILLVSVSVLEWMPGFEDVPMLTDLQINQRLVSPPGRQAPDAQSFKVE